MELAAKVEAVTAPAAKLTLDRKPAAKFVFVSADGANLVESITLEASAAEVIIEATTEATRLPRYSVPATIELYTEAGNTM